MTGLVPLVAAAAIGGVVLGVWWANPDCSGGHHWKDEPESTRYFVRGPDLYAERFYACEHDGCHAENMETGKVTNHLDKLVAHTTDRETVELEL